MIAVLIKAKKNKTNKNKTGKILMFDTAIMFSGCF